MADTETLDRRELLAAAGTTASVLVAGCSSGDGSFGVGDSDGPGSSDDADSTDPSGNADMNTTEDSSNDGDTNTTGDSPNDADEQRDGEAEQGDTPQMQTIEGFEGDLSAWTPNGVGSESGLQSQTVKSGRGALDLRNVGGRDSSYVSQSGGGLDQYPQLGDATSIWTRASGGDAPTLGFCYCWQRPGSYSQNDTPIGYAARIHVDEDRISLAKFADGSTEIDQHVPTSTSLSVGEWYRIAVTTTTDGAHEFVLEDASGAQLATVTMQDTEFESGGYALVFHGNETANESSYWDDLSLTDRTV